MKHSITHSVHLAFGAITGPVDDKTFCIVHLVLGAHPFDSSSPINSVRGPDLIPSEVHCLFPTGSQSLIPYCERLYSNGSGTWSGRGVLDRQETIFRVPVLHAFTLTLSPINVGVLGTRFDIGFGVADLDVPVGKLGRVRKFDGVRGRLWLRSVLNQVHVLEFV
ncbi:hypothetical protein BV22DRAFT_170633 [Leucogyrophana mollusca]|uniref:Uncharacterized protein n=1 Tax=Leucogyrophana mollusca TaxID=85980 RepID=A0ACB8BVE7_9AGAM|nr:hypothetical protein BV22DRAFT_170633 [Leucogyrophana mollusca]